MYFIYAIGFYQSVSSVVSTSHLHLSLPRTVISQYSNPHYSSIYHPLYLSCSVGPTGPTHYSLRLACLVLFPAAYLIRCYFIAISFLNSSSFYNRFFRVTYHYYYFIITSIYKAPYLRDQPVHRRVHTLQ